MNNIDNLEAMRHSLAHILAAAVQELYPKVEFGIGPAIENGFYYDFANIKLSEADLPKIEKKMREIIVQDLPVEQGDWNKANALKWAASQPFKKELVEDLVCEDPSAKSCSLTFYRIGNFTDLCAGPHLKSTSEVGAFKLTSIAGAYWRGDETRAQMTRVYGIAFKTQQELDDYTAMLAEAEKRDHRKLGAQLDLFTFSSDVGSGLPMFTPRGTILFDKLSELSLSLREKIGHQRIRTPHITKTDLYKLSGHWDKFGDELFMVKSQETSDQFVMKPMSCPHHIQIYLSKPRSYRDLPVRLVEAAMVYRDEKKGELGGMSRVRAFTQDDSHILCRKDQIKPEVDSLIKFIHQLYGTLGMTDIRARLSYRDDGDGYLGDRELWNMAESQLKALADENHLDYYEAEGEAAFYGPKIDFMAKDAIGREFQVATVQLDFNMPGRFGLEYTNEEGKKETPVMLHHAALGSVERFLSVFIEHTAGHFPFWCAPEQVRVLTIGETKEYAEKIETILAGITLEQPLKHNDLRYKIDSGKDNLSKKIKRAEELKIPVLILVGPKDAEAEQVTIRTRDGEEKVALKDLSEWLKKQA